MGKGRGAAKGRTLVKGTLLLTASGLALRGLGVLFHAVLAKRIGAEGMGLLQLVLTVGGFAGTLGTAGVRVAALQLTARAWGRGDRAGAAEAVSACLRYACGAGAAVGAGLVLLAGPIGTLLLRDVRAVPALRVLGLLLPWPILAGVLRAAFTACGRVRELVAVDMAERLASLGLTLGLMALAGSDPARLCAAVAAGSWGTGVFAFFILRRRLGFTERKRHPLNGVRSLQDNRQISVAGTAAPLGVNDALRAGLGAVEQLLIPWGLERHGSRHSALAAYGTVSGMVFPLLWFPGEVLFAMNELLVSETARLQAQKERRRLKRLARRVLGLTALWALGVGAVLWFGGGPLGRRIFRSEEAGRYLRLFAPMVLFLYPDVVVDGLQKGLGQQLHLVRYNTFTNVIDVLGLWLLLPRFGMGGYVFTYCLSHLVNLFLSLRRLLIAVEE